MTQIWLELLIVVYRHTAVWKVVTHAGAMSLHEALFHFQFQKRDKTQHCCVLQLLAVKSSSSSAVSLCTASADCITLHTHIFQAMALILCEERVESLQIV